YLEYLQAMKELDLSNASEFLVMAATLLRLKSKLLLPRQPRLQEEEEIFDINSPEDLFNRLEEYRRFKEAALRFKDLEKEQQKIFLRSTSGRKVMVITRQQSFYTFWEGPHLLSEIMHRFAELAAAMSARPVISGIEDFKISDKMALILNILERSGKVFPLKAFLSGPSPIWELIVVFIAVLELTRQKKIVLYQDRPFGHIYISLSQSSQ
ncbi:MAG: segregation/condensation protein A, partial [Dethiobacter sp.]|nr:segregation/condensation protein A [Dethiobacter sp.]